VLVVFHLKNSLSNFLFGVFSSKKVVFLHGNLGISSVRDSFIEKFPSSGDPNFFFVIIDSVRLKMLLAFYDTFILNKRMNIFLSMCALAAL
jgi:hypothetical protein